MRKECGKDYGLVPRPPPFFVFRFAFGIIHGSGRAAKKNGEVWCLVDLRRIMTDRRNTYWDHFSYMRMRSTDTKAMT